MEFMETSLPTEKKTPAPRKPISQGAHALSQALNRLVDQGVLPQKKFTDYLGQLTVSLNQAFQAVTVLQSSGRAMMDSGTGARDVPWDWFLLHQDEAIRIGVVTVNPYRPVPVHDHSGAGGILLTLEGHLVEKCYDLDLSEEDSTGLVKLLHRETRHLQSGQWGVHFPGANNLHSLAALGRPAVALSVQFQPGRDSARSWFLTTGDEAGDLEYAMRSARPSLKAGA